MGKPIRTLIIDDSEQDSLLLVRALVKAGYEPEFQRVDNIDNLQEMIAEKSWDLVLCDSRMPTLRPETALAICQQSGDDAPFIMVSGAIDYEEAVTILKAGAQDFIKKDKLARLGPVIERELREKVQRQKRRQAEEALRKSEERYMQLFKAAEVSIWDVDLSETFDALEALREQGITKLQDYIATNQEIVKYLVFKIKIKDANYAALRMFGTQSNQQLQHSIPLIFGKESFAVSSELLCAIWNGADVFRAEAQLSTVDGRKLSVILSLPIPKIIDSLDSIPISILDITERRLAEQKLRENEARMNYLAYHDALTDLPNRLLFQDRLQHSMFKARRSNQQLAILFLDLDRFKTVNDSLGHDVGDKLLQKVAIRLQDCMRHSDTVARLGGDEFVVILEHFKELKEVILVARKIINMLSVPTTIKDQELSFTTSIGISLFPSDSEDVEGLMKCADMAMYRAKERGRNNYQFYTSEMSKAAIRLLMLEGEMRRAMIHNELVVYYQPQFELVTQRLIGVEALVRWEHPQRGIILPADFIPLAEETGLIVPIGEWVMRTACAQNKAWQKAGYSPFRVAVNLSGRQFAQKNIVRTVDQVLSETKLDAKYLELELTETVIMHDADAAIAALEELSRMEVTIAIDDFGTGYSSLSYLQRFPINRLKIDKSFVRDCILNENDATIITSIIALAHGMGFEVIAEGVETEDQLYFLSQQHSDGVQGFLYSHALNTRNIERLLTSWLEETTMTENRPAS
ncbi:MAG: EAL domain-containing protein [Gammaproteobacteria bacterium]|nr:EAL domain-containing protein [Gammaproteobacteria bacterium]